MGKYMLGLKQKELVRTGLDAPVIGNTIDYIWTGYNIKQDDEIWIKQLGSNGDIIAKLEITSQFSTFVKDGKNKIIFSSKIISVDIHSTNDMFLSFGIKANSNHGRLSDE